eukprot:TRINITY_DN238_c0_g3_i2.p1 TRINITY_DN238_c0_g3~~TRINITY_DN238_c0_g3_i2.p1  ORF type:complete len:287 (+),score=43.96 TRINITY_DN238_c0_g3_i2:124-984(+)
MMLTAAVLLPPFLPSLFFCCFLPPCPTLLPSLPFFFFRCLHSFLHPSSCWSYRTFISPPFFSSVLSPSPATPSLEQLSQAKQAVSSMGSTLFKPGEASPLKVDGFVLDCAGTHRSFSNFVDAIGSLNVKLDGVLFNDEVLESKYVETSLGLERMLHYNYYSRFVLGNLLIDHLQPNGLIVNSVPESMRIGDTQYLYDSDRPREEFDPLRTYAAVACANGVFTSQLASRLALEEDCSNMWSYASVTPHAVNMYYCHSCRGEAMSVHNGMPRVRYPYWPRGCLQKSIG